jgi:thiosulfate dehydrogenase (quinone) large subunit
MALARPLDADRAWAIFFARTILGWIFFMAGVWKVFQLGPIEHARRLFIEPYAGTFLPAWSLWATGTVVPFVELVAGGLVLIGLWTRAGLLALGGVLVLVTFGHLVKEPLYSFTGHVIPRTALLLFVLMLPREADWFSVDHGLARWRRTRRPAEPAPAAERSGL